MTKECLRRRQNYSLVNARRTTLDPTTTYLKLVKAADETMLAWQSVSTTRFVLGHGAALTWSWRAERALAESCLQCQLDAKRTAGVERGETCLILPSQLADQLVGRVKGAELGSSVSSAIWTNGVAGHLTSCLRRWRMSSRRVGN